MPINQTVRRHELIILSRENLKYQSIMEATRLQEVSWEWQSLMGESGGKNISLAQLEILDSNNWS